MVDSHLPAVPEILATIPIGTPLKPVAVYSTRLLRGPPVAARVLETMAESSARDESGSRDPLGTVSASRIGCHVALSLSGRSGRVRQAKRRGAMRNASSWTASTSQKSVLLHQDRREPAELPELVTASTARSSVGAEVLPGSDVVRIWLAAPTARDTVSGHYCAPKLTALDRARAMKIANSHLLPRSVPYETIETKCSCRNSPGPPNSVTRYSVTTYQGPQSRYQSYTLETFGTI